jgi:hypothetical protein
VKDAETKMILTAEDGQGKYDPLAGGKEWSIRNLLVAGGEEQTKAVHHLLGSKDFNNLFQGTGWKRGKNRTVRFCPSICGGFQASML